MDEFFDVLRDEPLEQWYEIGNVITIVDAKLEEEMSEEANYLLASEAAYAGRIILSHADEVTEEQKSHTIQHLNKALEQIQCKRRLEKEILCKSLPNLSQADFEELLNCGYVMENYRKMDMEEQKGFDSLYFMNENVTEDNIQEIVKKIMDDSECGSVFRVKGFVKNAEDKWLQLNATHNGITMQPIEVGQEVLIVIGEKLQEDKIKSYVEQK